MSEINKIIKFSVGAALCLSLLIPIAEARSSYSQKLCQDSRFSCIQIKSGDSWQRLWPNEEERDIVKRVNRINIPLYSGMVIAVPRDLSSLNILDIAPFKLYLPPIGQKTIVVDQKRLAWGAYNANGELLHWGPISAGQSYCADIKSACRTKPGTFFVYDKRGANCKSTKFPVGKGGAPMPYCMFFHGGQALHGSYAVVGYNASHGCVRMFPEDAEWLSKNFVTLPGQGAATRVIVEPL